MPTVHGVHKISIRSGKGAPMSVLQWATNDKLDWNFSTAICVKRTLRHENIMVLCISAES